MGKLFYSSFPKSVISYRILVEKVKLLEYGKINIKDTICVI